LLNFLITRLRWATGLNFGIQDRRLAIIPGGSMKGSHFYRKYMEFLINLKETCILVQDTGGVESSGNPETKIVEISFEYWKTAPVFYDIAVIFAHETWHIFSRAVDGAGIRNPTGGIVVKHTDDFSVLQDIEPTDFENIIRDELCVKPSQEYCLNPRVTYAAPLVFLYQRNNEYRLFKLDKLPPPGGMTVTEGGRLIDLDIESNLITRAVLAGYVGGNPPPGIDDRITLYRNIIAGLRKLYIDPEKDDFKGPFGKGRIRLTICPTKPITSPKIWHEPPK
jgi:hypothetical protein